MTNLIIMAAVIGILLIAVVYQGAQISNMKAEMEANQANTAIKILQVKRELNDKLALNANQLIKKIDSLDQVDSLRQVANNQQIQIVKRSVKNYQATELIKDKIMFAMDPGEEYTIEELAKITRLSKKQVYDSIRKSLKPMNLVQQVSEKQSTWKRE